MFLTSTNPTNESINVYELNNAGSLIKIDEEIVTPAVASVTLTGIDSTYDVYMVK